MDIKLKGNLWGSHHSRTQYSHASTSFVAAAVLLLFTSLTSAAALAAPNNDSHEEHQRLFWLAKQALRNGNLISFNRYASRLRDDPLYPYLLYWRLESRLSQELTLSIETFLQRYADTPLAPALRTSWLQQLAKQERWEEYLDFYQETDDAALRCHYHYAQHQTGNDQAAWEGAKKLWLVGTSQDDACDPLFSAWEKAGGLTRELRWRRIELAMDSDEFELASLLARPLGPDEQQALRLWQRAYHNPALLQNKTLQDDKEINRSVISHTLQYRATRAPLGTIALWSELEPHYAFTTGQRSGIARAIAIGLTYANDEHALDWFAQLPREDRDLEVCNYAVRVALRTQNWGSALAWLEVMPGGESRSTKAQYWRGRIFEAMGFSDMARHFFKAVSKERTYYGFLAADRLNLPYNLEHDPLEVKFSVLQRVAFRPDIVRAQKLYHLGLVGSARNEWEQALAKMSREEMLAAGKLADAWGWENRALFTLARANYFDDLSIRFPLRFNETVLKEAKRRALDPAWIYAVVRQESAMMPHAQSPVGALGLMQLMPATSRDIARELQLAEPNRHQLLKPETNIHFGSYYLRQNLKEFDDNPVLATAAYNAGPHRIRKWYPKQGVMDADIWVDTIPFDETREYVRMVMAYSVFYDQRLDKPVKRLSERMRPISKTNTLSRCGTCTLKNAMVAKADTN